MKANNFNKTYNHVYKVASICLVDFSFIGVNSFTCKCLRVSKLLALLVNEGIFQCYGLVMT